jgi:hypothetical protein
MQQSRLATSGVADNGDELARLHVQIQTVQHTEFAIFGFSIRLGHPAR